MTGRAKGRLAVLALGLVLVGTGGALAFTRPGRARVLTWLMRAGSPETRRYARRKLVEIGRPELDRVLPELVAGEVRDRLANVATDQRVAFVGEDVGSLRGTTDYVVELPLDMSSSDHCVTVGDGFDEPGAVSLALASGRAVATKFLIVGRARSADRVERLADFALDYDDPLLPAVLEETRARLAEAR